MSQPETTPQFDAATLRAIEELAVEEAVRNHRRRVRYPKLPEIAILRPFCSNDWRDWPWTRPFTRAGYTWASNRNIIVRIPAVEGVPVYEPDATDANPYLDTMLKRRPDILRVWELSFNEVATRPLFESRIKSKHMRLIERLPSVMIEAEPLPGRPVSFRFEGGEGVMLGLKTETTGTSPWGSASARACSCATTWRLSRTKLSTANTPPTSASLPDRG